MEGLATGTPISDVPHPTTGFNDQGLSDQVGFKRANSARLCATTEDHT